MQSDLKGRWEIGNQIKRRKERREGWKRGRRVGEEEVREGRNGSNFFLRPVSPFEVYFFT